MGTLIEVAVKTSAVRWTIEETAPQVDAKWEEHINGAYTGISHLAGWVNRTAFIENDNKFLFGHSIKDDWGVCNIVSASRTAIVMNYWNYQKAKFTMTWTLEE